MIRVCNAYTPTITEVLEAYRQGFITRDEAAAAIKNILEHA